jgi:hypothetical protein
MLRSWCVVILITAVYACGIDEGRPVDPDSPMSPCGDAYQCFQSCRGDLFCVEECVETHPESHEQAGEAWYSASVFGDLESRDECLRGD